MKQLRRRTCVYCEEFDPYATGVQLRKKREALSLSQSRLADCLSLMGYRISVNSLGAWERGEKIPSLSHLFMLAHFYECTLNELVLSRRRNHDDADEDQLVHYVAVLNWPYAAAYTVFLYRKLRYAGLKTEKKSLRDYRRDFFFIRRISPFLHPPPPPLHRPYVPFLHCQRHQRRVALADAHGAADLLGDNDTPEVIDAAHDTGSFHILKQSPCFANLYR